MNKFLLMLIFLLVSTTNVVRAQSFTSTLIAVPATETIISVIPFPYNSNFSAGDELSMSNSGQVVGAVSSGPYSIASPNFGGFSWGGPSIPYIAFPNLPYYSALTGINDVDDIIGYAFSKPAPGDVPS